MINRIASAEFPGGKITARHEKLKQETKIDPTQSDAGLQLENLALDPASDAADSTNF